MREKSPRELISAYFDGELTPAEVLEAEHLLERDADARRFLEELESMRGCLSDLPRATLPLDWSQRVLQEAERRMLQRPATVDTRPAPHSTSRVVPAPWVRIGAAFVIAASLLLAFILPGRLGNDSAERTTVALRDEESTPAATMSTNRPGDRIDRQSKSGVDFDGTTATADPPVGGVGEGGMAGGRFADKLGKDAGGPSESFFKTPAAVLPGMPRTASELSRQQLFFQQPTDELSQVPAETTNSYVMDVSSDTAQNRVLERFEQVLIEQQIALEDNGLIAERAAGKVVAAGQPDRAELQSIKETEKAKLREESAPQTADRVYVIDATPLQLSNTIDGLNRLAGESETPVRLRRLGTVDNNSNMQSLYSAAGEAPGQYGYNRGLANTNGVAGNAPASGPANQAGESGPHLAGEPVAKPAAAGKLSEPAARPEAAKKGMENESAEVSQRSTLSQSRESREQKQMAPYGTTTQRDPSQRPPLSSARSNTASTSDETQQRAIFIFRVVPPVVPASPAPTAEPPPKP